MSKYAILLQIYWFLEKTIPKDYMKHKTILIFLALLLSFSAHSRPARKGITPLMQPDGSVFEARIRGDEFMKITTTLDGCAIIQEKDGWWCYAGFDSDGSRKSSGCRVGDKVPAGIISESREIPYRLIYANAGSKRSSAPVYEQRFAERMGMLTKGGTPATKHGIVILAQFNDVRFKYDRQDFIDLLTKEGYSSYGAAGSAKEYFDEQFAGLIDFRFDVSEIVTLPGKMADYGGNMANGEDKNPAQMVIEACQAVDDYIDFTIYDDDKDGEIDNVFIFFAGADEAEGAGEDCIWSHAWYIFEGTGQTVTLDGKMVNRYACCSELSRRYHGRSYDETFTGIGTFCHEYSHTFGLPDFYDTDYEGSGGNSAGLWIWTSLMDGGNQNDFGNIPPYYNAIEREILGICEPVTIRNDGEYAIGPIDETNLAYRIETDNEDEYFLIECRSGKGWDTYIGGKGLLVYHIDRSRKGSGYSDLYGMELEAGERWTMTNEVNCRPDHQCADLIEADGRTDSFSDPDEPAFISSYKDIRNVFYPSGSIDSIIPEGDSGLRFWSGIYSPVSITDIRWADGDIRFRISNLSGTDSPPEVVNIKTDAFPDAAIIGFESSRIYEGEAIVEWGRPGYEKEVRRIKPYKPGKFAVLLEDLATDNKTYTVTIGFEAGGKQGEKKTVSFMTKKAAAVQWAYIYMNGMERNADGSIKEGCGLPLRLSNAADAAEISWTFNDRPAVPDGDLYFRTKESGTLKAHIIWKDGSEETILKEIIISKGD